MLPLLLLGVSCGSTDNSTDEAEELEEIVYEESTLEEAVCEQAAVEDEELGEIIPAFSEFNVGLYLNDPDPEGPTNVRAEPGGEVVLELPKDDFMINVIGAENGWLKINEISSVEEDIEIPGGVAWIHYSVCAGDLRNYGGTPVETFQKPEENGDMVDTITEEEMMVRVVDGSGDWVEIYYTRDGIEYYGWIKAEMICGNPYTTCS